MGKIYSSILETIGNTPVVKINNLGPKHVNLFVKVESFNPMGSIKDRLALGVIEDAENKGELKSGQTIVEATSGNTGIGLAMVCAQKGYPLVITMAENFSVERRKMIRFLGAQVVLTPASEKGTGMVKKADELALKHGWWQPKQFENPANADVHQRTTAQEILDDFSDRNLHYWVSGFGTGGTFNGVSRALRKQSPNTKIMLCEPDNAQLVGSGISQSRHQDGSPNQSHPNFRPHLMQGWSPDFIPSLVEQAVNQQAYDATVPVDGNFSLQCAKDLAQKEGVFVGITAGATFAGALKVAETAPKGSNILCMLPDTGERYLTTPLFEDIAEDMSASEMEISRSTLGYRFDLSNNAVANDHTPDVVDENAVNFVAKNISDTNKPVVMFALEWCEFCWSVRKMLKACGIDFESIDLDSMAYQHNNIGGKIRTALREKTGWNTFPQIFIGGEFVGGCTDLFDGCNDGSLFKRLNTLNITYNTSFTVDPYTFLPKWLHTRQ